jgi:hypothetical protein
VQKYWASFSARVCDEFVAVLQSYHILMFFSPNLRKKTARADDPERLLCLNIPTRLHKAKAGKLSM